MSEYTSLVPFQGVLQTDGLLGREKVSINSKAVLVMAVPEIPCRDIYLNCGVIDTVPVSKSSCCCSQPDFNLLGSPLAPCTSAARLSSPGTGWKLPTQRAWGVNVENKRLPSQKASIKTKKRHVLACVLDEKQVVSAGMTKED